ncbi:hypothetical protein [uncultured Bartonella sp.]|uniref:hypothetical protein n=1 Tax=uncultured Bartonella sp. TaxID=104108 RepID=UPI0025DFDBF7|nr:hypothetical protein [uncultured Bartonella sp.]
MKSKSHATWLSGHNRADISEKTYVRVFPFRQRFLSVRFQPFRKCYLWKLNALPVFHLVVGAPFNCGVPHCTDRFRCFIPPPNKINNIEQATIYQKNKNKTENEQNKNIFIRTDQRVMLEITANYI